MGGVGGTQGQPQGEKRPALAQGPALGSNTSPPSFLEVWREEKEHTQVATQWEACTPRPSLHPFTPVGSWPSPIPSGSLTFPLQVMGPKHPTASLQSSIGCWAPEGSSARVCPPPLAGAGVKAMLWLLRPDAPALPRPCRVQVPAGVSPAGPGEPGPGPATAGCRGGPRAGVSGSLPSGRSVAQARAFLQVQTPLLSPPALLVPAVQRDRTLPGPRGPAVTPRGFQVGLCQSRETKT